MQRTYKITMPNNSIRYITASRRMSAALKLTGMRLNAAIQAWKIKDIKLVG